MANMPSNINAARMQGYDVGATPGRNMVGNALNMTTNLFDAGDKVVRNVGEGNLLGAGMEALRFLPGARMTTGLGKQAGKYLKLPGSPNAVSSVDDIVMYRTQKPGQTEEILELMDLQKKANDIGIQNLSLPERVKLAEFQSRPNVGQAFDTDLTKINYYGNPNIRRTRGYTETPEVLRITVPRKQAELYNVKNFPEYAKQSTKRTEYILPMSIIQKAEKFSFDDLAKLQGGKDMFKNISSVDDVKQAGFINMKGAFQKYPKGKLTKEELEAYMNSDFYKESLKRHREAKKAYGDKWDLDPLAKEYLRENFLTGNRTGINSVLYGGENWSWPDYLMAGVVGGAMPSVAGLYGLALAPPAVRSKVMRSIGIQGVPGGLEAKDTTIDITNKNMDFARVNEIKDGTVIIGGEFIESSNNTVRKAKDWLRAEDTYSDKNYPSDKIESFYGVEDGKFKVGKAKDFKSETQLVPRRFGAKNISKAVLNGVEMRLLDNKGQPIYQNTPNTGKFILYSPSTKKAAFIYITNGKRGVEEVNKFLKENKDAQYIHLDNGRYEFYGVNEQGLTQQDFKNYYEQDINRKGNPGYNLIIKKTGGTFFQQGGTTEEELTPAQLAMMKARLAYAHMHGNPSAQRMVAPVDNPYIFTGTEPYASPDTAGYSGTHYMFSQGPFAVPTIQTGPDGQLYYNVNASPNDSEAMQFDSPEDAEVFARYYKTVAPAFQDMELTDEEIEEYKRGGCTIVKL
jgi:hypothetical protein